MLNRFRGEIYLITGALFFSFNGVISTLVLDHLSPFRLTQVRCIGAFAIIFVIVASRNFQSLKATRREIPTLALLGIVGFAAVQLFHVSSGVSKFDPLGMIPTVIFIALFLWKCRASD